MNSAEPCREKARLKGRIAAQERLQLSSRFFHGKSQRPGCEGSIDPVDYLAFRGLGEGTAKKLMFIDRKPDSSRRERLYIIAGRD